MNLIPSWRTDSRIARLERNAYDLGLLREPSIRVPDTAAIAELARSMGAKMAYSPAALTQLLVSGNDTPASSGLYVVRFCGGGGGGGGGGRGSSGNFGLVSGTPGGGASSTAEQLYALVGGTSYAFVCGAGGPGGTAGASDNTNGGNGTGGTASTYAGPGGTLTASGGGPGQGAGIPLSVTAATISGQVISFTVTGTANMQVGESYYCGSFTGGAWTNLNGLLVTVLAQSGSSITAMATSGTIPSGTWTAGLLTPEFRNGGIPGANAFTVNGDFFGPGFGSEIANTGSAAWTTVGGTGPFGLASGGGGAAGSTTAASKGSNGGGAGTISGNGVSSGNGSSATGAGTAGSNGPNNSGAGGGGGGCALNGAAAAAGGVGGSGYGYRLGPF